MPRLPVKLALKNFKTVKNGHFSQKPPAISQPFQNDNFAQKLLKNKVPIKSYHNFISNDLTKFSNRIVSEIHNLGRQNETFPVQHKPYDAWGNRIDELVMSTAWPKLKSISAEEGLIAIGYEGESKEFSRIHQFMKLSYFGPHSGMFSCPLAMTDGAAHVLKNLKDYNPDTTHDALNHLTTRDPKYFWTSGQWMTEKKGGSDVGSATDTIAVYKDLEGKNLKNLMKNNNTNVNLHGFKWFTSSTDADMSLTLGRNYDEEGNLIEGTRGLTMYFVKVHDKTSSNGLNNIQIVNLKNKLGTKGMPTTELILEGTKATQLGDPGRGIATIANMLHLTRLHNSASAAGNMRAAVQMAKNFSKDRFAFGDTVNNHSLHVQTLSRMEIETRAAFAFMIRVAELFGQYEHGKSEESYLMMRSLTPLLKYCTAKQAMSVVSESLECFGGSGYIEDSEMPVLLRDSQVLPIWEGTSNIMSLDFVRSIASSKGESLRVILEDAIKLSNGDKTIMEHASNLSKFAKSGNLNLISSRDFATNLSDLYMSALLINMATDKIDDHVAKTFQEIKFHPGTKLFNRQYESESVKMNHDLVYN